MAKQDKLSLRTKLCYGCGCLGYGSMGNTLGNFIMFFGTSIMGISGSLVGIAMAIASIWDGISDPLVGYISDNTRNKVFGRRLGYMLFGSIAIALLNILIWTMPQSISEMGKFFWLLISMLALESANTFFGTPYSALGIDIAPDYNEQSKVQGCKTVFSIVAMILPSILLYIFMPSISFGIQTQFTQDGYINIAYVNSALVLACTGVAVLGTIRHVQRQNRVSMMSFQKEKFSLGKLLAGYLEVLKKRNFRSVILGYSMANIASAFLTGVGMHLFTYCYHFSSPQISILLITLFGGAICSQPLWISAAKRLDKKRALVISLSLIIFGIALTAITFLFRAYLPTNQMFFLVMPCLLFCGLGAGAMYSLPMSMYADVVTLEMYKTGNNNAGSYAGYYSFTYNLSNSIALLIIGFLLDLIKFDSTQPVQAMSVQNGLGIIVVCGCCVALSASILLFSQYTIKRSDVLKVQLMSNEKEKIAHK